MTEESKKRTVTFQIGKVGKFEIEIQVPFTMKILKEEICKSLEVEPKYLDFDSILINFQDTTPFTYKHEKEEEKVESFMDGTCFGEPFYLGNSTEPSDKWTLYDPAFLHYISKYGPERVKDAIVNCDHCRMSRLDKCYGIGENIDLCLSCYKSTNNGKDFKVIQQVNQRIPTHGPIWSGGMK